MFHTLILLENTMTFAASDVVSLSQARATLLELAEQVKASAEKIITKNGKSYIAIIDAKRLDYYHRLKHERIHLLIIDDARKGLDDVITGNVNVAHSAMNALELRPKRTIKTSR